MEKQKLKKSLSLLLKIVLTSAAVYWVTRKIDLHATGKLISSIHIGWILLAFITFNLSKIVSAFRLNTYFQEIKLNLSTWFNIKLYWLGMFYNLFLPGGIGGDGYKVYLLHKHYQISVKLLGAATLLDRLGGMVALVFLALVLSLWLPLSTIWEPLPVLIIIGAILAFPTFYFISRWLFKSFQNSFAKTNLQSLAVQGLQVIAAYFILRSLNLEAYFAEYQVLFLISSVVAVLPFTIGGVGARELVFIYGYEYLPIEKNTAVAFSLLFFVITAISSFLGVFVKIRKIS